MKKIEQFKIEVACDFKDPNDSKYLSHIDDGASRIRTKEVLDDRIHLVYIGSIAKNSSDNALDFIDEVHKYVTNDQIADEIAYCVFGAIYSLDSGEEITRIKADFDRHYFVKMSIPNSGHVSVMLYRKDGDCGEVFRAIVNPRVVLRAIMKRLPVCGLVADYKVLKLICEELLKRYEDGVSDRYVDEITMMDAETKEFHKYNLYFEIPR